MDVEEYNNNFITSVQKIDPLRSPTSFDKITQV